MFGRARAQERAAAAARNQELHELRAQVQRLKQALAEVIAASDDAVRDLERRQAQHERLSSDHSGAGFAAAWSRPELQTSVDDDFFLVGQVDQRARKWLLSPN